MTLLRYVLRELLFHFVFASTIVVGICVLGTAFQFARTFEGLGFSLLLRFIPMAIGYIAPWAILVSAAVAATLVYARLSADNEIDAMRMGGISPGRIMLPALLFGLLLSVGAYLLAEYATPAARHSRRKEIRESVLHVLRQPPSGPQRYTIVNYRLSYLDCKDGRLDRPALLHFNNERLIFEYYAPEGRILVDEDGKPTVIMSRPRYAQFGADGSEDRFRAEGDVSIPIELEGLAGVKRRPENQRSGELWTAYYGTSDPASRNMYLTILHGRYAQALAPLLLVLVCVPAGIVTRRGSRLAGLGAALPPLLLQFTASFFFEGLGQKGRLDGLTAAWASDAILALLAAFLLPLVWKR